jgi:hypothetical protein
MVNSVTAGIDANEILRDPAADYPAYECAVLRC